MAVNSTKKLTHYLLYDIGHYFVSLASTASQFQKVTLSSSIKGKENLFPSISLHYHLSYLFSQLESPWYFSLTSHVLTTLGLASVVAWTMGSFWLPFSAIFPSSSIFFLIWWSQSCTQYFKWGALASFLFPFPMIPFSIAIAYWVNILRELSTTTLWSYSWSVIASSSAYTCN